MYKFDVFQKIPGKKGKSKKVGTHKYQTYEEAENAKYAISHIPNKEYTYIPREGAKEVTKTLGGYKTSNIVEC